MLSPIRGCIGLLPWGTVRQCVLLSDCVSICFVLITSEITNITFWQISLMSASKKTIGYSHLLLHSVFCDMMLWLKYIKKILALCIVKVGKSKRASVAFSDHWGSFWYYTKFNSCNFLIVSCRVEPEMSINELFISVTLKSIDLSCTLMDLFTHAWFYNIIYWVSRKHWFTELCNSSKCWHSSLYDLKIQNFNITSSLL